MTVISNDIYAELASRVYYNATDGNVYWKPSGINNWDSRFANVKCGSIKASGLSYINFLAKDKKHYFILTHKLIKFMTTEVLNAPMS